MSNKYRSEPPRREEYFMLISLGGSRRRGTWWPSPWLDMEGRGGVGICKVWGNWRGTLTHLPSERNLQKTHTRLVTRCDHTRQTMGSQRLLTLKENSLQVLKSHFLPPPILLLFINILQSPDFQWLSSDLRWPPYRGWQYNKRNGVMKSRISISTLLAIHIPAREGRGFIIW